MRCRSCRAENLDTSRFCEECGTALVAPAPRPRRTAPFPWIAVLLIAGSLLVIAAIVTIVIILSGSGEEALTAGAPTTAEPATTASEPTAAPPDPVTTAAPDPATTAAPDTAAPDTTAAPMQLIERCVIGRTPGTTARMRTGPAGSFTLIGELPYDTIGVITTPATAYDSDGDMWREVVWGSSTGWVVASALTPGPCTVGTPDRYSVVGISCADPGLNVRTGFFGTGTEAINEPYAVIAVLAADATNIPGTGVWALDSLDRQWLQIRVQGQVGWAASWYLTTDPARAQDCS
jgi:hypothetical protein